MLRYGFLVLSFGFLFSCDHLLPKKDKNSNVEAENKPQDSQIIPIIANLDGEVCNAQTQDKMVFLSSENQIYHCKNSRWLSFLDEQLLQIKNKLVGDWHAPCFNYPDRSGSLEHKIIFYENGNMSSGTAVYEKIGCSQISWADYYKPGQYELKNSTTLFMTDGLLYVDFYVHLQFIDDELYLAQPLPNTPDSTELEPYSRPLVKFQRAEFPASERGIKSYFDSCHLIEGCLD